MRVGVFRLIGGPFDGVCDDALLPEEPEVAAFRCSKCQGVHLAPFSELPPNSKAPTYRFSHLDNEIRVYVYGELKDDPTIYETEIPEPEPAAA